MTQGRHCPFEHPKKEDAPAEAFIRVVEMDTAIDQDFREERAMARFYPRSEAAVAAEAAAVVAAWEAKVVAPPAAAPPGAAPAEGEAEDLLPFQRAMDGLQPESPTYSPLRPGQGLPVAKEPRYEEEDE